MRLRAGSADRRGAVALHRREGQRGHAHGRMRADSLLMVRLILRDKEFEVRGGMTLLSALQKVNILPESIIATRGGEMILEDEILKEGDVVRLIAVISGG